MKLCKNSGKCGWLCIFFKQGAGNQEGHCLNFKQAEKTNTFNQKYAGDCKDKY